MLWGLDELVTYHYLIAEVYRVVPPSRLPYAQFWEMTQAQQADHIWKHLFVERSPISEACRGVVTALRKLGLDPAVKSLAPIRRWFAEQDPDRFIDRVMELSGVESITMTNAVFDENERGRWLNGIAPDSRFRSVLRIDPIVCDWPGAAQAARVGLQRQRRAERRGREGGPQFPARMDRTDEGHLRRGQLAAGVPLSGDGQRPRTSRSAGAGKRGAAGVCRDGPAVCHDDRLAPPGESGPARRRRHGRPGRRAERRQPVPCVPRAIASS